MRRTLTLPFAFIIWGISLGCGVSLHEADRYPFLAGVRDYDNAKLRRLSFAEQRAEHGETVEDASTTKGIN